MRQGWTGRTPGPRAGGPRAVHSGCDGQPWRALTRERQDWICGLEGALLLPRVSSICSIVSGSCGHCGVFVKTLPSPALPHPPLIPSSLFPVLSSPIHSPRGQSTPSAAAPKRLPGGNRKSSALLRPAWDPHHRCLGLVQRPLVRLRFPPPGGQHPDGVSLVGDRM